MKLRYNNPGIQHSIDSIMLFLEGDYSEYWFESSLYFYPQIDKGKLCSFNSLQKRDYLLEVLSDVVEIEAIKQKVISYQKYWDSKSSSIQKALEDTFDLQLSDKFNDMTGNITLNPICPRFLDERRFDVFYLNSEKGALGMAIHEIIHFVWFYVWNCHFKDDKREYENPHLKWIFSEMVVDTIMRNDKRLYSINPYFESGCAYDYFYTMKIEGTPVLDILQRLFEVNNILSFMEKGYQYCLVHEKEIRNQMKI